MITSPTGAAIQDILQQLRKRYPLAEVLLHPTLVQGDDCIPRDFPRATGDESAGRHRCTHRRTRRRFPSKTSGHSTKNASHVRFSIPEFLSSSAVGHETDFTIADWVADHRAPTPSAAVEHIVPDQNELFAQLNGINTWLRTTIQNRLNGGSNHDSKNWRHGLHRHNVKMLSINFTKEWITWTWACRNAVKRNLTDSKNRLHALAQHLNALSPLATLKRGYSITRKTDGEVLTDAEQVSVGDKIEVQFSRGHLTCRVEERLDENRHK